jgi:actin-related protein
MELMGEDSLGNTKGLKPDDAELRIFMVPNPELNTWHGLQMFAKRDDFEEYVVERSEYEEEGPRTFRKFNL